MHNGHTEGAGGVRNEKVGMIPSNGAFTGIDTRQSIKAAPVQVVQCHNTLQSVPYDRGALIQGLGVPMALESTN